MTGFIAQKLLHWGPTYEIWKGDRLAAVVKKSVFKLLRCEFTVDVPGPGDMPIVAQIPIHLPGGRVVESICVLTASHDLLMYDLATGNPETIFTGGQILRKIAGPQARKPVCGDGA